MSFKREELKFKDQPDGDCFRCKWNQSAGKNLSCTVPDTHVSNPICIQKRTMITLMNLEWIAEQGGLL